MGLVFDPELDPEEAMAAGRGRSDSLYGGTVPGRFPMPRSLLSRSTRSATPSPAALRTAKTPLWVLLTLLLVPAATLGQEGTTTLSGRVLDVTDGSPVGFASVLVENADSGETLTGTLTGEDGRFLVQGLAPAEYTIWTSFPGFHTAQADVLVGELNQSYDLGDIPLARLANFRGGDHRDRRGDPSSRARHAGVPARRRTDAVEPDRCSMR